VALVLESCICYRSEIHEKMNCTRCRNNDTIELGMVGTTKEANGVESVSEKGRFEQFNDIGGFAEISGCLHQLKSSERQVYSLSLVM